MRNTISFETALALKEAGFPQPQPDVGQFWYRVGLKGEKLALFFIREVDYEGYCREIIVNSKEWSEWHKDNFYIHIFAPTLADILKQLPGIDVGFYSVIDNGFVFFLKDNDRTQVYENPEQGAAEIWIAENTKQPKR